MLYMVGVISSSKRALVLMLLIAMVTIIDSQFVNTFFYGTNLGRPGNLHLLLFGSFVVVASIVSNTLLLSTRNKHINTRNPRTSLFRASLYSNFNSSICNIISIICHDGRNGYFSGISQDITIISSVCQSFLCTGILGVLSITFIQWYKTIDHFRFWFTEPFSLWFYSCWWFDTFWLQNSILIINPI